MLKIIQINLHHSKSAPDNLLVFLGEEDVDIGIVQEYWVKGSSIKGLKDNHYNIFYKTTNPVSNKPRSCILAKKHLKVFLCPDFSSDDLTVVKLEVVNNTLFISSIYKDRDRPAPAEDVRQLTSVITAKKDNLLLGCDRHTLCGSSEIKERGESLFDFLKLN